MRKSFALVSKPIIQKFFLFLAFLGALAFFSCESYRTALEVQYFQQGQAAFEKKDYAKALEFFGKAQKVSFNNVARYRMAEIHLIQDEFEEAKKLIKTLLRIDRKNILVYELNILWHIKKNEREKAAELFEALESKNIRIGSRAYANIAIFYLNGREYKKALDFFRKADDISDEQSAEMVRAYLSALRFYVRPPESKNAENAEADALVETGADDAAEGAEAGAQGPKPNDVAEATAAEAERGDAGDVQSGTGADDAAAEGAEEGTQSPKPSDEVAPTTAEAQPAGKVQTGTGADAGKNGNALEAASTTEGEDAKQASGEVTKEILLEFDRVTSLLTGLYEKNKVSTEVMMQAAEDLVNDEFFAHAFALYKAVAEKNKEDEDAGGDEETEAIVVDAPTRVKAHLALINLIAKKQYEVSDEHAPLTVMAHIKEILKLLFPRDESLISEYTSNLFELLKIEEITDVLKAKMREVYNEYDLKPEVETPSDDEKSTEEEATADTQAEPDA